MTSRLFQAKTYGSLTGLSASCKNTGIPSVASAYRDSKPGLLLGTRGIATLDDSNKSDPQVASATATEVPPRIKFKRLDKTARHIMQAGNLFYFIFLLILQKVMIFIFISNIHSIADIG